MKANPEIVIDVKTNGLKEIENSFDRMILLSQKINESLLGVAVVHCQHCGQWGARFCECRKCGAPIE